MKKNRLLFFYLIIFSIIICCKSNTNIGKQIDNPSIKKECMSIKDRELIVSSIINHIDVKKYLDHDIGRMNIKLSRNYYLNDSLNIYHKGKKVLFSKKEENYTYLVDISFREIECNKSLLFSFYYSFEGAHIEGFIKKINNKWVVDKIFLDAEE